MWHRKLKGTKKKRAGREFDHQGMWIYQTKNFYYCCSVMILQNEQDKDDQESLGNQEDVTVVGIEELESQGAEEPKLRCREAEGASEGRR